MVECHSTCTITYLIHTLFQLHAAYHCQLRTSFFNIVSCQQRMQQLPHVGIALFAKNMVFTVHRCTQLPVFS